MFRLSAAALAAGLLLLPAAFAADPPKADKADKMEENGTSDAAQPKAEGNGAADSAKHKVAKGETLFSIAKKHGLKSTDLAKWNNIRDPSRIRVGQELALSAP